MTEATLTATKPASNGSTRIPAIGRGDYVRSVRGLIARDTKVLLRNLGEFLGQTIIQPLLFVFVFAYVFPKINQSFGGGGQASFATILIPGLVATSAMFTGISAVAQPLSIDLGVLREIEDRAMAPLPLWMVGLEKVLFGAFQSLLAGLIVFPLAYFVPSTPVTVHVHNWWLLIAVGFITCLSSGALGLFLGSAIKPEQIGVMYGILVIPLTFLGCVYFPWRALAPIGWLHVAVLANPLVYAAEGLRAALTPQVPHMSIVAFLLASAGICVLLLVSGLRLFIRRVQL